jgi:hypothetical protein
LLALNPGQVSDTDIVVEDYMYVMGNNDVVIELAPLSWQHQYFAHDQIVVTSCFHLYL